MSALLYTDLQERLYAASNRLSFIALTITSSLLTFKFDCKQLNPWDKIEHLDSAQVPQTISYVDWLELADCSLRAVAVDNFILQSPINITSMHWGCAARLSSRHITKSSWGQWRWRRRLRSSTTSNNTRSTVRVCEVKRKDAHWSPARWQETTHLTAQRNTPRLPVLNDMTMRLVTSSANV